MRAVIAREYGPPEVLRVEDVPDPAPGPGEVLVDVQHAAVNYPDVLILANRYQIPVALPFTPGSEFAGTVAAFIENQDAGGRWRGLIKALRTLQGSGAKTNPVSHSMIQFSTSTDRTAQDEDYKSGSRTPAWIRAVVK